MWVICLLKIRRNYLVNDSRDLDPFKSNASQTVKTSGNIQLLCDKFPLAMRREEPVFDVLDGNGFKYLFKIKLQINKITKAFRLLNTMK